MRSITGLFFMAVIAVPAAIYQISEMTAFELHSRVIGTSEEVVLVAANEGLEENITEVKHAQLSVEKTSNRLTLEDEKKMVRDNPKSSSLAEKQPVDLKKITLTPVQKINEMPLEQWMEIKGIGQVTAERILNFRKERGEFESLDELLEVKGIGPAKYAAVLEWLELQMDMPD